MALLLLLLASTTGSFAISAGESSLTRVLVTEYVNQLGFDVTAVITKPLVGEGSSTDIPAGATVVTTVELLVAATSTDFLFTVRGTSGGDITYSTLGSPLVGTALGRALSTSGVRVVIATEPCDARDGIQGLLILLRPKPAGLGVVVPGPLESRVCAQRVPE